MTVIDTIKELSNEGIVNVIGDQYDMLIGAYDMPRNDLDQFAQELIDNDYVDEVYFIIELDSE